MCFILEHTLYMYTHKYIFLNGHVSHALGIFSSCQGDPVIAFLSFNGLMLSLLSLLELTSTISYIY